MADDDVLFYKPQTEETRAAYEALLAVVIQQLHTQPPDVLAAAADEILSILKQEEYADNDDPAVSISKKQEVEKLLCHVSDATFQQLVSIAERITDFQHLQAIHAYDDDQSVAVEFAAHSNDENQEPVHMDRREVQVQGDDDNSNNDPNNQSLAAANVHDIDANRLHRNIRHTLDNCGTDITDLHHNQNLLAEEILKILAEDGDDRELETRLVMLFDYDNFDLVKFLLHNRLKIVWCTRLARARRDQENKIEEEMKSDPRLTPILDQLRTT